MNISVYCNGLYVERTKGFRAQRTYSTLEKLRGQPRVLKINVFNNVIVKIDIFNNVIIINNCKYFSLFCTHSNAIRKGTTLTLWRRKYFFLILAHPVYKM